MLYYLFDYLEQFDFPLCYKTTNRTPCGCVLLFGGAEGDRYAFAPFRSKYR